MLNQLYEIFIHQTLHQVSIFHRDHLTLLSNIHLCVPGVIVMAGVAKFCSPLKSSSVRGFRTSARRLGDATPKEVKGTPYNKLNIGIPAESWTNEKRVACTPAVAAMFTKKGFTVHIQEGAGKLSSFRDDDFAAAGAKIVSKEAAFQQDITLKLRQPSLEETKLFR